MDRRGRDVRGDDRSGMELVKSGWNPDTSALRHYFRFYCTGVQGVGGSGRLWLQSQ
ncbi:hypothetical protein LINPERPRIM_LOCUS32367 [Linum perenne]